LNTKRILHLVATETEVINNFK